ncbi:MAG: response regulator [Desulfobacteraceae bacterium]|nr:response regulator [Desulfobacteraceae bacterium]
MKKKKINILLVDDNENFLTNIAQRVKLKGFNVFTALNGSKALEIAKKQHIHVAVVDQKMPDMPGLVVITRLKELIPHIKTILLTGHGGEKLKEATQALNSSYFDKSDMGKFWNFLSNLPLGNINILLVDDNQNFLDTLAERIKLKGYDTYLALNGAQALEIAKNVKLHLAVVDQKMPDMDGLIVITKLKEIDPDIQTILLTGHGDEKLKEATQALNSAYFDKAEMNKFWNVFRKLLLHLEQSMAAAAMTNGGNLEDAVKMQPKHSKKK